MGRIVCWLSMCSLRSAYLGFIFKLHHLTTHEILINKMGILLSWCYSNRIIVMIALANSCQVLRLMSDIQGCCCLVAKSYLTLLDPVDCSPPDSSVHRISQVRILEWFAIFFSRESSRTRAQTCISCITGRFFTI